MKIIMVCGPPGAGKTTYIHSHAQAEDVVIDIDLIPRELSHKQRMEVRRRWLDQASEQDSDGVCWFSTAAPRLKHRRHWRRKYPIERTIILFPPLELALQRAHQRDGSRKLWPQIYQWYALFDPPTVADSYFEELVLVES